MSEWKPYKYQREVTNLLLSGKSVILQAPTGAGKTTAALLPFLHAWREETDEKFPVKCVYTVPMRVLANQFMVEYEKRADSFGRRFKRNLDVRIQTGEHSGDREFEGDLIFCTIDQFLSSYLTMPYSLPRRKANINAGAFVGSYLVFDEFHLLDPDSTLPTTLYAIKRLSQIAPVLLMTATFSSSVLYALQKEIYNSEVILVDPEEARSIETLFGEKKGRQRMWQTTESPLSATAIFEAHKKRSLAICNTVRKAQELYRELKELTKDKSVEVLLLHSRFLQEDRQAIEKEIRTRFGRDNSDGSIIAIATQTIEVGVDITSEVLHTELAPASSLIQRAGRCARYAGDQGQVIVYPVEKKSPYLSKSWENEMDEALKWLNDHNNKIFDFGKEQEFVNAVATPRDEQILVKISAGRASRDQSIHRALIGDVDSQATRDLVRDADSKLVLIHPDPKNQLTLNPHLAKGFNIQTKTLFGMVKEWRARDVEIDWRIMRLIEDRQGKDKEESNRTDYDWQPLTDEKVLTLTRVIVVNPELAGYLKDEGFVSNRGNTDFVSTMPEISELKETYEVYSYKKELYEDHIKRVLEAFQNVSLKELTYSAKALEQAAGWSEGSVMRAVWLACLFHDVGKLSEGWQGWARAYQKEIGDPVSRDFSAGHTEFDRKNPIHDKAEKSVRGHHPKPNHAGESALAIERVIVRAFTQNEEGLTKAILTAITRHHTPFAHECGAFALEGQAESHIHATLDFVPEEVRQRINLELLRSESKTIQNSFSNSLIAPDDRFGWMAYMLLARALRHSDQEGTKKGSL